MTLFRKMKRTCQVVRQLPGNIWQAPVIILCYHRVADLACDKHELSVSPANFREQIRFLRENYHIVRFDEPWDYKKMAFCITFDDGYADNLYEALPILKEFEVPATFFITAGFVGGKQEFPWDGGIAPARKEYRQLTHDELLTLGGDKLVTIGSHTVNHRRLSQLPAEQQKKEITEGHHILEQMLDKKLQTMSYPFGNYCDIDDNCKKICRELGLLRAAANFSGQAHSWSDPMALPRHVIRNYDACKLKKQILRFKYL